MTAQINPQHITAIMGALGLLGVCFLLWRRSVKLTRRGGQEPYGVMSRMARREALPTQNQPLRGESEALLVELREFGREIEGRIDTRIRHLAKLIAEADAAVERLNGATARAQGTVEEQAGAAPGDAPSLRTRIMAMSREGRQPGDIARTLGVPAGEVELVLGLERGGAEER